MRNTCHEFEDMIWENARNKTELPKSLRAHIRQCSNCALALREARQITDLMLEADCVPAAPDCRSAVMAKISPAPAPARRFAWVQACAGLAIAAVVVGGIMNMRSPQSPVVSSVKMEESGKPLIVSPRGGSDKSGQTENMASVAAAKLPAKYKQVNAEQERAAANFRLSIVKRKAAPVRVAMASPVVEAKQDFGYSSKADTAELGEPVRSSGGSSYRSFCNADSDAETKSAEAKRADTGTNDKPRSIIAADALKIKDRDWEVAYTEPAQPIAVAVVTWPTGNQPAEESYNYTYTERNTDNNSITTGTIKRTGDTIDVYLEVKPENAAPTGNGSIDHEAITSA